MTKFIKQGNHEASDFGYEYDITAFVDGAEYAVPREWAKTKGELNQYQLGKIPSGQVAISVGELALIHCGKYDDESIAYNLQYPFMVLQEIQPQEQHH